MNLFQILTAMISIPGFFYFVLYYRLRKKELKVKIKNNEIDALSKIVHELKDEIRRKDQERADYLKENQEIKERISAIESDNSFMKKRIAKLETSDMNNEVAFAAISLCDHPINKCPILAKRKELNNDDG